MERDVSIDLLQELLAISTMTLATSSIDGQPHAAPVYFVAGPNATSGFPLSFDKNASWKAPALYFFSDPQSHHGRDLEENQNAAAAIYPPCFDWQDIRGVQMHGIADRVNNGALWDQGWHLYQAKFPFTSSLTEIVLQSTMYVFIPQWLRLIDNRRGFGFKQEWERS